jgi:aryl-alcohol dehydrogenase-like predicted oxidoreductase
MGTEKITKAALGTGGPEVGVQGLGCMGMNFGYGPTDTEEARATLERALELGVTLYDTADMYGWGENEKFIAPFVNAHRDEVVLATKFGIVLDKDEPAKRGVNNDPAYIRSCVEGSLRRLDVDVIDLYYMHRRDVNVPIEETVGTMAELVAEGKVKQLGLSEVTGPELEAAHGVHPIAAVQSEWSLFSRDVEAAVVPTAARLGVTFVPYSPLGRGFLTGAFKDAANSPRTTTAVRCPASPATTPRRTRRSSNRCGRWPSPAGRPSGRSPWPGCSSGRRCTAFRWCRSRAPASAAASRRTRRRPDSS